MKKFILIIAFFAGLSFLVQNEVFAQTEGIELGLRFANAKSAGIDFAMPLAKNRLHAFTYFNNGLSVVALYDWQFPFADGFMFYPGVGLAANYYDAGFYGSNLSLSAAGEGGIEYQFDFPLTLGVDYQLRLGMVNHTGFSSGWALNARWRFNKRDRNK